MEFDYVTQHSSLARVAEEIDRSPLLPLDKETTGLDPHTSNIRLLTLKTHAGVRVIDLHQVKDLGPCKKALQDYQGVIIGQGLKFDQKFALKHWGLEYTKVFDTYRASALIYNGKWKGKRHEDSYLWLAPDYEPEWDTENNSHDLYALYERELGIRHTTKDHGASDWSKPNLDPEQLRYAAEDVIHLERLREVLRGKLIRDGLTRVAKIEFEAILPEAAMELNGLYLDQAAWLELAERNRKREARLREALTHVLPDPFGQVHLPGLEVGFNLNSSALLLKSLKRMGFPLSSTAETELAMHSEYTVIRLLLKWRGYAQCIKTFGPEYLKFVNPVTGHIHTSFFAFTGAGRYSSGRPNLQQVPHAPEFRRCFRAAPGKKLVIRDYSQIELRVGSEIANDRELMGVYQRGEDAHRLTAAVTSGVPLEHVTKDMRQAAKAINFGLIYGMQAEKLVLYAKANYGVDMSVQQAEVFRERYFQRYRGIKSWHDKIFDRRFRQRGYTKTILGRVRYLPPYPDPKTGRMRDSYNEYSNTPVQGSAADGLKASLPLAYRRLKRYNNQASLAHMVHDEIAAECDDDPELCEVVNKDLEEAMAEGMGQVIKRVPVVSEGGVADTWAEK